MLAWALAISGAPELPPAHHHLYSTVRSSYFPPTPSLPNKTMPFLRTSFKYTFISSPRRDYFFSDSNTGMFLKLLCEIFKHHKTYTVFSFMGYQNYWYISCFHVLFWQIIISLRMSACQLVQTEISQPCHEMNDFSSSATMRLTFNFLIKCLSNY